MQIVLIKYYNFLVWNLLWSNCDLKLSVLFSLSSLLKFIDVIYETNITATLSCQSDKQKMNNGWKQKKITKSKKKKPVCAGWKTQILHYFQYD